MKVKTEENWKWSSETKHPEKYEMVGESLLFTSNTDFYYFQK